jgi:hypothetical protein
LKLQFAMKTVSAHGSASDLSCAFASTILLDDSEQVEGAAREAISARKRSTPLKLYDG